MLLLLPWLAEEPLLAAKNKEMQPHPVSLQMQQAAGAQTPIAVADAFAAESREAEKAEDVIATAEMMDLSSLPWITWQI